MKKMICMIAMVVLVAALAACGKGSAESAESASESEQENSAAVPGSWEVCEGEAAVLPDEVQAAFDKATETLTGAELIPVAYVGTQVVAGTNYMVLCRSIPSVAELAEDAGTYQMIVIYADLSGGAEITQMTEFNIADYTETDGADPASENLMGGWTVPEQDAGPMPEEAQAAFDKACGGLDGNDLVPLALLGTQTVSGTNYAILCCSSLVTAEPVTSIQVVTVYEDLDGNAEILNICTLDPADYNK